MPAGPGGAAPPIGGDPALDYLVALTERFDEATAAAGAVQRDHCFGGLVLRLRFAGSRTAEMLLPPFEHLAIEPGLFGAELTISAFDTASTGVEAPALPWRPPDPAPGTNPVSRLESRGVSILAAAGTGALTVAEPATGAAVFHIPDAGLLPGNERAAPLREAFHLLGAPRRRWMTHAGAVGREGRGVLLVGGSGSGKSTLALSCALAGMELVADDYLLLETEPAVAHALQSTVKLTGDSARRLGLVPEPIGLDAFEATPEGPAKAIADVASLAPGAMRRRLAIGAIVAPSVAGLAAPELEQVAPSRGLRALAPSTVLQMRSRSSSLLAALAALSRAVPSFELRLASEPAANAAVISELVDGLG